LEIEREGKRVKERGGGRERRKTVCPCPSAATCHTHTLAAQINCRYFISKRIFGMDDERPIADSLRVIAHCSGARRQKAIKFTYDIMNERWQTENTYVTIAEVRFAQPHCRKAGRRDGRGRHNVMPGEV
jgi:hypothetical protein